MFSLNLFPRECSKAADSDSLPKPVAEKPSAAAASASLLGAHKGKLAVGAAAMLGIAIFYRWRESKLAKEDPEQYAQLKRLKAAIAADATAAGAAQSKNQPAKKNGKE